MSLKSQKRRRYRSSLIVTYTEAAAREMKNVSSGFTKAMNEEQDPERRRHFSRQIALLPTANISTLHAFCLTVIRRFII